MINEMLLSNERKALCCTNVATRDTASTIRCVGLPTSLYWLVQTFTSQTTAYSTKHSTEHNEDGRYLETYWPTRKCRINTTTNNSKLKLTHLRILFLLKQLSASITSKTVRPFGIFKYGTPVHKCTRTWKCIRTVRAQVILTVSNAFSR
jgi:hypothetical protein